MKVDYEKYPEIPQGCLLNYNKYYDSYQVFRQWREIDPTTNKSRNVRETVGVIKNGSFKFSPTYLLRQEAQKHKQEADRLRTLVPQADERTSRQASGIEQKINSAVKQSKLDLRKGRRTLVPVSAMAMASLLSGLGGETEAVQIADFIRLHADFFSKYLPDCGLGEISHGTVRRCFMMAEPKRFRNFYIEIAEKLIKKTRGRIVAVDGQAVRATGRRSKDMDALHGTRMLMSVYDTTNRVCLAQELIQKKTNEITVGYRMIESLALDGSIVTADAMSCQVNFVNSIIEAHADYVISLKGNQDTSWQEVSNLFAAAHRTQLQTYEDQWDLGRGRIEKRTVEVLPGRLLSAPMKDKWLGLAEGCIVRIRLQSTNKASDVSADGYSYYISSIAPEAGCANFVAQAVRAHWGIENNLHYMLDVFWRQDRMQAQNANYICNRSALNKLCLAFLENYRAWLVNTGAFRSFDDVSIKMLQARCRKPEVAVECLAVGLSEYRL